MRDWLPQETLLRQKLIRLIESHYQLYGFQPIDTPAVENIEVLQGKGGGENEKLMFGIVNRGEEFQRAFDEIVRNSKSENELQMKAIALSREERDRIFDMGLRF